jgi:hypothetical protein
MGAGGVITKLVCFKRGEEGPWYKNIQEEHVFWLSFDPIHLSTNTAIVASSLFFILSVTGRQGTGRGYAKIASRGGGGGQISTTPARLVTGRQLTGRGYAKIASRGGGGGGAQFKQNHHPW